MIISVIILVSRTTDDSVTYISAHSHTPSHHLSERFDFAFRSDNFPLIILQMVILVFMFQTEIWWHLDCPCRLLFLYPGHWRRHSFKMVHPSSWWAHLSRTLLVPREALSFIEEWQAGTWKWVFTKDTVLGVFCAPLSLSCAIFFF